DGLLTYQVGLAVGKAGAGIHIGCPGFYIVTANRCSRDSGSEGERSGQSENRERLPHHALLLNLDYIQPQAAQPALQSFVAIACRTAFKLIHNLAIGTYTLGGVLAPHGAIVTGVVAGVADRIDVQALPADERATVAAHPPAEPRGLHAHALIPA